MVQMLGSFKFLLLDSEDMVLDGSVTACPLPVPRFPRDSGTGSRL
jgi:hypothetical protein